MRKRFSLAVILALILALSVAAVPAHAGYIFKFQGNGAFAAWFLEDEANTYIDVFALDGKFQSPPGRPAKQQQLGVSVFQSFCDAVTNEWVFRNLFAFTDEADIHIDRKLNTATASASLVFQGFEERYPGCFDGEIPVENGDNGNGFEFLELPADVSFTWDGIGNLIRIRSSFHYDAGPDLKFRFRSNTSLRAADATGSVVGLEAYLPVELGPADYAEIFSTRDMEMLIGNEFFF